MFKQLCWLMLGAFAVGTESFMTSGLLPVLARDLHVPVGSAGRLVILYSLTYAVAAPVGAVLTANWPRERVLRVAIGLFAAGAAAAALSPGLLALGAARCLTAVAAALFMGAAGAHAAAGVEPQRRGQALALLYCGMTAASVLGVPAGTLLGHAASWRAAFALVAGVAVAACIGLSLRRGGAAEAHAPVRLRDRLRPAARSDVQRAVLVTLLWFAGAFAFYTYLSPFLSQAAGWSAQAIAATLSACGLAGFAGNLAGGKLADRFGPKAVVRGSLLLLAAVLAGLSLLAGIGRGPALHAGLALLAAAWAFAAWSITPAQQLALVQLEPRDGAAVLSLNSSAMYFGVALGAGLGGMSVEAGATRSLGLLGAAFVLLAFAATLPGQRSARPAMQPA